MNFRSLTLSTLALLAFAATAPALSQSAPAAPEPGTTFGVSPGNGNESGPQQMFQVVLVVADQEAGGEVPKNLPKGVAKALADLQDFLPYKRYTVVDSSLLRAAGYGKASLEGPGGDRYVASINFRDEGKGNLMIDRFALTQVAKPSPNAKALPPGVAPEAPDQPVASTFRIARGETVVVGSSGIKGGKALIVLLTAVL